MRHAFILVTTAAGLLASSGCASNVDGEVGGEKVPTLFSAFFTQHKADAFDPDGNEATLFTISGGALSQLDGCNAMAKRQENATDAFKDETKVILDTGSTAEDLQNAHEDLVDALVNYDEENLPTDFWFVGVSLSAFSSGDLDGGSADINLKEPDPKATEIGGVSICRVNDLPQKHKDKDGNASLREHQTCYAARKGTVEVKQYTEDKTLEITADVTLIRAGGDIEDDQGGVAITISGGWCEDLENATERFEKAFDARLNP